MELKERYNVTVTGGGISGTMAAIAAGRNGSDVLLIEQYGFLGGALTCANVGPMMTFHAGEKQIIRGLTGELIDRLVNKGKSPGHIYDTNCYTYTVTPFDSEAMKYELDLMCKEAGVTVLFHTMLAGVTVNSGKIESIKICNKAGITEVKADTYIDATGDADLSAWSGVDFQKGRLEDGKCQPCSLMMRMAGVDIRKVRSYVKQNPQEFPTVSDNPDSIDKGSHLGIRGFLSLVRKAKENNEFNVGCEAVLIFECSNHGEVIVNTSRIFGCDFTKPLELSDAEMIGREQVQCLQKFLKKYVPGFEKSYLVYSGPHIGIRGSRQIKGVYTLTKQDILSFRSFEDTIAHTGYPIDIHPVDIKSATEDYSDLFMDGKYYDVPYRCLINDRVFNLITVGRCISADFIAQGGIRTTPTMGAVGQAGGMAASMASGNKINFSDISIKNLRSNLVNQGAFLD